MARASPPHALRQADRRLRVARSVCEVDGPRRLRTWGEAALAALYTVGEEVYGVGLFEEQEDSSQQEAVSCPF